MTTCVQQNHGISTTTTTTTLLLLLDCIAMSGIPSRINTAVCSSTTHPPEELSSAHTEPPDTVILHGRPVVSTIHRSAGNQHAFDSTMHSTCIRHATDPRSILCRYRSLPSSHHHPKYQVSTRTYGAQASTNCYYSLLYEI